MTRPATPGIIPIFDKLVAAISGNVNQLSITTNQRWTNTGHPKIWSRIGFTFLHPGCRLLAFPEEERSAAFARLPNVLQTTRSFSSCSKPGILWQRHGRNTGAASDAATPYTLPVRRITDYFDRMSGSLNAKITKKLAYAFFSSATPFRFVENAALKERLALLRPSYELPSRRMLSGTLLDEAYDELHTKMRRQIASAQYVAIVTDSWTDVNGCPIMNYIVLTPEPFFYKSVYTRGESHTASFIADQLSLVIDSLNFARCYRQCCIKPSCLGIAHEQVQRTTDNVLRWFCTLVQPCYPRYYEIVCFCHP